MGRINRHGLEFNDLVFWHEKIISDCIYVLENKESGYFDNELVNFLITKPFVEAMKKKLGKLKSSELTYDDYKFMLDTKPKIEKAIRERLVDIDLLKKKIERLNKKTKLVSIKVYCFHRTNLNSKDAYDTAFYDFFDELSCSQRTEEDDDGFNKQVKITYVNDKKIIIEEDYNSLIFTYDRNSIEESYALKKLENVLNLRGFKYIYIDSVLNEIAYKSFYNMLDTSFKLLPQNLEQYNLFKLFFREKNNKDNNIKPNGLLGDNKYSRVINISKIIDTPVLRNSSKVSYKTAAKDFNTPMRNAESQ